jgi:hypothetical protein
MLSSVVNEVNQQGFQGFWAIDSFHFLLRECQAYASRISFIAIGPGYS